MDEFMNFHDFGLKYLENSLCLPLFLASGENNCFYDFLNFHPSPPRRSMDSLPRNPILRSMGGEGGGGGRGFLFPPSSQTLLPLGRTEHHPELKLCMVLKLSIPKGILDFFQSRNHINFTLVSHSGKECISYF